MLLEYFRDVITTVWRWFNKHLSLSSEGWLTNLCALVLKSDGAGEE